MIRYLLALCALLFTTPTLAYETILLTDANTAVLRTPVDDESTARVMFELIEKDAKLPAGQPLYLYLDTPGGSVTAGVQMIVALKALKREIKTISSFAASMGFITVQALDERLVLPHGVLMSHRASGGESGHIPGEVNVRINFWTKYLADLDNTVAKRLGLTGKQLQRKHWNELWSHGARAVKAGLADRVVMAKCGPDMIGAYQDKISTPYGSITTTWARCPLIVAPLKVDVINLRWKAMSPSEVKEYNTFINKMFYDKPGFLTDYILTGRYKEFIH